MEIGRGRGVINLATKSNKYGRRRKTQGSEIENENEIRRRGRVVSSRCAVNFKTRQQKAKQLYRTPNRVTSAVVYARDDKGNKSAVAAEKKGYEASRASIAE